MKENATGIWDLIKWNLIKIYQKLANNSREPFSIFFIPRQKNSNINFYLEKCVCPSMVFAPRNFWTPLPSQVRKHRSPSFVLQFWRTRIRKYLGSRDYAKISIDYGFWHLRIMSILWALTIIPRLASITDFLVFFLERRFASVMGICRQTFRNPWSIRVK